MKRKNARTALDSSHQSSYKGDTPFPGMSAMNLRQYKLLSIAGVASIHLGYLGLWAGEDALGATVFGAGASFTLLAVVGALWFSGSWKKPDTNGRLQR
jgi:hypothetical protein